VRRPSSRLRLVAVAALLLASGALGSCSPSSSATDDPLHSWNETASKQAITAFVARTTTRGSDYIAPPDRIAVFDNDGTLWGEQPLYFQLQFAIDRVTALAPAHPEWTTTEPFASLLKGNTTAALAGGMHAVANIVAATHAGVTTEEFDRIVSEWLATARHPRFKRPYTELVYQPMLELLAYLRANGFKTFIVSGGGVEFLRAFAERVYGIPPEQVVGSRMKMTLETREGRAVLVKLAEIDFVDDGPGKPVGIETAIGRRPVAAFGNSDGDLQMLEWTSAGTGARFCLYVHHTDPDREWAYDRDSSVGRLDKGLEAAKARGWTVVDMKTDWKRVFAFDKEQSQ
jgi:phosphoglycolate phosphatase-like HAD superfamily hydrolase